MRDQAERPEKNNRPRLLAIARKKQKRNHNGSENDDRVALGSVNMKEDIQIRSQRDKRSQGRLRQVDPNSSERSKRDREMEERLNQAGHCSATRDNSAAYDRFYPNTSINPVQDQLSTDSLRRKRDSE